MRKGKYYQLALDCFGQPNGIIYEIYLTKQEFLEIQGKGLYIFKKYEAALWRAQQ